MSPNFDLTELSLNDGKFRDQLSAVVVDGFNINRISDEIEKLGIQDENFILAVAQVDKIRDFIGSPQNILGSDGTKHGEIAEQVEVGIRNARQALHGQKMTATFDGVGRTAATDYMIDGIRVQSKYINGANNNLKHVLGHMEEYSDFGRDGSYYHIPKDAFRIIDSIAKNENVSELNSKTIQAIRDKIVKIEEMSGKSFDEVVRPGISEYAEVQKGRIHQTLNAHENELINNNNQINEDIRIGHKPSLNEGVKVAASAGAVGASVSLTMHLYKKWKQGKKFYRGEFTLDDWKEVGIGVTKDGTIASVTGLAVYGLTNYACLSAPFAGAVVSASRGIAELAKQYHDGVINEEGFLELGMIICSEAAVVGFATYAGQALIPIPVLGAIIGSFAGSMFANFLGPINRKTAQQIRSEMTSYLEKLEDQYQQLIRKIDDIFNNLDDLTREAFDFTNNLSLLNSSIHLATAYGVSDERIIHNIDELDAFMLK